MLRRFLRALTAVTTLASCSSDPEGTVALVTGDETDVFSRAPAPVLLVTEKITTDGTKAEIARAQLPVDSLSLPPQQPDDVGALLVSGLDSAGAPIIRGETLFVQWGAIKDTTLEVFVQRLGELARLPRGPAAFDAAVTSMVVGRYVLAANGTSSFIYDLLALKPLGSVPTLPRPAKSIATVQAAVLLIDEAGATTLDLTTGETFPTDAPVGGNYGEIAGGARVGASDGSQFVVGATRASGGATARVLMIDKDGKPSFVALATPRDGACATYVEGRGLIVAGGDATAPGAEVLAPEATGTTALPFPPDAVRGCALATLDNTHVAIAGGGGPVRVLDLTCAKECVPIAWANPIPLTRVETVALSPTAVFILGDDATGATHAYRASPTDLREIPLRTPRRNAHLVVSPTNALMVVAGGAPGIEQYME